LGQAASERDGNSSAYPPLSGDGTRFSKTLDLGDDLLVDAALRPSGGLWLLTTDPESHVIAVDGVGALVDVHDVPSGIAVRRILPRDDGGLYIIGLRLADLFVARVDAAFQPVWTQSVPIRPIGAIADDVPTTIAATMLQDGTNDIVVGSGVVRGGVARSFVLRMDEDGNVLWVQDHDTGAAQVYNQAIGMSDGSVLLGGTTELDPDPALASARTSTYLLRLEGDGAVRWARSWGTAANTAVLGMTEHPLGGVVCAVHVQKPINEQGPGGALVRFDDDGSFLWAQSFAGTRSDERPAYNIPRDITTSGDGVVVVGELQAGLFADKTAWIGRFVDNVAGNGQPRPMAPTWWAQYQGDGEDTFLRVFDVGDALLVVGTTDADTIDGNDNLWVSSIPYEGLMPYRSTAMRGKYTQRFQSSAHELRVASFLPPPYEAVSEVLPQLLPLQASPVAVVENFPGGGADIAELAR
jgi:hypothetical protein